MKIIYTVVFVFLFASCMFDEDPIQEKTADNGDNGEYSIDCIQDKCWLFYGNYLRNKQDDGKIGLKYSINGGEVKEDAMDNHRLELTFPLVDTLYLTWYGNEEEKTLKFLIGKDFFERIKIKSDSIVNIDLRGAPYQTYRYGISSRSEKLPRGNTIERESNTEFLVHGLNEGYGITLRPLNFSHLNIKSEISLVYDYSHNYY